MATLTATQDRHRAAQGAGSLLTSVRTWFAERHRRNAILRELNQYSPRELADLGITRGDFSSIAAGTFRRP